MSLGLFVKKWQPKVGLVVIVYDILFAYFVVEAKNKIKWVIHFSPISIKVPFDKIAVISHSIGVD